MIESAREFVALRTSDDPALYHRAAHDEATVEVWMDVLRDYPEMKTWVAHNKSVPISILETLATDLDPEVRYVVATRRKLSGELFALLAADPEESVRRAIVGNPKVPTDVLDQLRADDSDFVRDAVADRDSRTR